MSTRPAGIDRALVVYFNVVSYRAFLGAAVLACSACGGSPSSDGDAFPGELGDVATPRIETSLGTVERSPHLNEPFTAMKPMAGALMDESVVISNDVIETSERSGATEPPDTVAASTEPNLLVAFIGDQGNRENSDVVLELIKREGADAIVHNGDFDYDHAPATWNTRVNRVLGPDFPYFVIVGNHDASSWNGPNGYGAYVRDRIARVPEMQCEGDPGVKATCSFRGLLMVQSCVGTQELHEHGDCTKDSPEQVAFIRASLRSTKATWTVCNWHKNQNDMQVGNKGDTVGWQAYEACMEGGAFISSGHHHSYARTLTLEDIGNVATGHGATGLPFLMKLSPGTTFVTVSGLAGESRRDYLADMHDDDTWWASYYTRNRWLRNGIRRAGTSQFGALFVRFHVGGNPNGAVGYFKDIDGRTADRFFIEAEPKVLSE